MAQNVSFLLFLLIKKEEEEEEEEENLNFIQSVTYNLLAFT